MRDTAIQLDNDELTRMRNVLQEDLSIARGCVTVQQSDIDRWRAYLLDQEPDVKPMFDGASTIVIPYVKSSIYAVLAEVGPALLNIDPVLHVESSQPYKKHADLLELFYHRLVTRETNLKEVFLQTLYGGLRDSSALLLSTWDRRHDWFTDFEQVDVIQLDDDGRPIGMTTIDEPVDREGIIYDFPKFTHVPADKFGVIPAQHYDIHEAPGLFLQFTASGQSLMRGAKVGMYDQARVYELLATVPDTADLASAEDDIAGVTAAQPSMSDQDRERHKADLLITEVFYRYAPSSGATPRDWLFTLEETSGVILRARPKPYWMQQRPGALFRPYSIGAGIRGDSLASAGAGHVQEAMTQILRLAINCGLRGIDPQKMVPASLYEEMDKALNNRSRKKNSSLIPFPDEYFTSGNRLLDPIMPGYAPGALLGLLEYVDKIGGQAGSGVNDTRKNIPVKGDTSATEAQLMAEASKKLLGMMTENAATTLAQTGEIVHQLCRQYARDSEMLQQLWYEVNGDSGVTLEEALRGEYVFTANGMSETNIASVRAKRALERVALLKEEPRVMQVPRRRHKLISQALQENGDRNPEDVMGTPEEWEQEEGNPLAALLGGAPGGAPAGGGDPNALGLLDAMAAPAPLDGPLPPGTFPNPRPPAPGPTPQGMA